jgi:hypothetical protein
VSIPANTFTTNNIIDFMAAINCTVGSFNQIRMYINTSNAIGGVQLHSAGNGSSTNSTSGLLKITVGVQDAATLSRKAFVSTNYFSDYGIPPSQSNTVQSDLTINWTQQQYLIVTIKVNVGTGGGGSASGSY